MRKEIKTFQYQKVQWFQTVQTMYENKNLQWNKTEYELNIKAKDDESNRYVVGKFEEKINWSGAKN